MIRFSAHTLVSKLLIVFLLEIIFLAMPSISQGDVNQALLKPNPIPEQWRHTGASVEIQGAIQSDGGMELVLTNTGQGGWQQRFYKVQDALELRVGSSSGALITFEGRGENRKYTWTSRDPEGETQDITPFVGNNNEIRLWARVIGSGERRCIMDTLANGFRKLRWEFNDIEYHQINK